MRAHLHVVDDLLEQAAQTAVRYFLDADIHGDLFSLIHFSAFMTENLFFSSSGMVSLCLTHTHTNWQTLALFYTSESKWNYRRENIFESPATHWSDDNFTETLLLPAQLEIDFRPKLGGSENQ